MTDTCDHQQAGWPYWPPKKPNLRPNSPYQLAIAHLLLHPQGQGGFAPSEWVPCPTPSPWLRTCRTLSANEDSLDNKHYLHSGRSANRSPAGPRPANRQIKDSPIDGPRRDWHSPINSVAGSFGIHLAHFSLTQQSTGLILLTADGRIGQAAG